MSLLTAEDFEKKETVVKKLVELLDDKSDLNQEIKHVWNDSGIHFFLALCCISNLVFI
jgi:hypothetical protein